MFYCRLNYVSAKGWDGESNHSRDSANAIPHTATADDILRYVQMSNRLSNIWYDTIMDFSVSDRLLDLWSVPISNRLMD